MPNKVDSGSRGRGKGGGYCLKSLYVRHNRLCLQCRSTVLKGKVRLVNGKAVYRGDYIVRG